jgi:hypothetical protein
MIAVWFQRHSANHVPVEVSPDSDGSTGQSHEARYEV